MDNTEIKRWLHKYDTFNVDTSDGKAILQIQSVVETVGGDLFRVTINYLDLNKLQTNVTHNQEYYYLDNFYHIDRAENTGKSKVSFTMPFDGNVLVEPFKSSENTEFSCDLEDIL